MEKMNLIQDDYNDFFKSTLKLTEVKDSQEDTLKTFLFTKLHNKNEKNEGRPSNFQLPYKMANLKIFFLKNQRGKSIKDSHCI